MPYEDDLFTTVTDEMALAAAGDLTDPTNPMVTMMTFAAAVQHDDGPHLATLEKLCTPESWPHWDFDEVRRRIDGCGVSTRAAKPSTGEQDVRYGKFVLPIGDGDDTLMVKGEGVINAYVLTMQFRPEMGSWMAHAFGDYVMPEDLPRQAK